MNVELRPEVLWFAQQMELKLRENESEVGWRDEHVVELLCGCEDKMFELREAIERFCDLGQLPQESNIVITAAAAAAGSAMMIADVVRTWR
ncbi:MAG: hypothetical protein ACYTEQ_12330 [Planctomycetota bacterium]|jgi:hypothetical protein